jgi:hypothetical protein
MTAQTERYQRAWVAQIGKRRLTQFERALTDPELVSMKQELVKLDLRIADLEERAKKGESRGAWTHVAAFVKELTKLCAGEDAKDWDAQKIHERLYGLSECAEQGLDDFKLWDEVERLIELRRKISDTERKYEEFHKLLMPVTLLSRLFDDLHAAIEAVLPERSLQRALLQEVRVRLNGDRRNAAALVPIELPAAYAVEVTPLTKASDADADALESE